MNKNEAIILMYENTYESLNKIANYIEYHGLSVFEAIKLLRDSANQLEAQSKVVEIREELRTGKI